MAGSLHLLHLFLQRHRWKYWEDKCFYPHFTSVFILVLFDLVSFLDMLAQYLNICWRNFFLVYFPDSISHKNRFLLIWSRNVDLEEVYLFFSGVQPKRRVHLSKFSEIKFIVSEGSSSLIILWKRNKKISGVI